MLENNIYDFIKTLRPLYISIENKVREICQEYDISVAQRAILEKLYPNHSLSVPMLAEILILKRQSVQEVVNQLIEKKLLINQINPLHKKSNLYSLSEKGFKTFSLIHMSELAFLKQSSDIFTQKDITTATRVSNNLIEIFQEDS